MKKFIKSAALALASFLIAATLLSAAGVTEFSDVPADHWAYKTVMKMTEAGLFRGTTEPVNGVGTFSPDKEMTRAEFIIVSLRATFPDEAKSIENDPVKWWNNYYLFALSNDIVKYNELDNGNLDKPMTREEMAMILVRCVEKMGESLNVRVETTQIADYSKISDDYKDYVRDCFSFGLLCGIDDKGTFAPEKALKRSEAAAVLCRLTDKDARIEVKLPESETEDKDTTQDTTQDTTKPTPNPDTQNPPAENDPLELPWENGGKQPSEYTWEEYEALPNNMKNAFYLSFENYDLLAEWINKVHPEIKNEGKVEDDEPDDETSNKPDDEPDDKPNGDQGDNSTTEKKPSDYTWEEYNALPDDEKNSFHNKFASNDEFMKWLLSVQPTPDTYIPWENGEKQPSEYTWEEYNALTKEQQLAFYESFSSLAEFTAWYNRVQPGADSSSELPWENGGKQPSEYTWDEVQEMSEEMQEAFYSSFESEEELTKWLIANMPVPGQE